MFFSHLLSTSFGLKSAIETSSAFSVYRFFATVRLRLLSGLTSNLLHTLTSFLVDSVIVLFSQKRALNGFIRKPLGPKLQSAFTTKRRRDQRTCSIPIDNSPNLWSRS